MRERNRRLGLEQLEPKLLLLGNWDIASNELTIAAWINADSFVGTYLDGRIISKAAGDQTQDHYWMLSTIRQGSETRLRFRLKTNAHTDTLIAGSGNLSTGQWHHVAAVYDGAMMRLYLDGAEVGAMPKSGPISTNGNVPVWIGNNPGSESQPFDGRIDDVRVFDQALTPLRILALVSAVPAPSNQAPVVDAGPNRSVVVSASLTLDGTVSDDGLPNPPATVTTTWSQVSGPGTVTFGDASAVDTTASFSQTGTYVLRLDAHDGEFTNSDNVTLTLTDEQEVTGFFVSPGGSPSGDGSINNPWDLQTALSHPSAVQPGDTIWLRGGTYRGGFTSKLTGTADKPIIVRAYPGERVIIDLWEPSKYNSAVPPRSGIFTLGPTIQHWEDDRLIWEWEVDQEPLKALADLIHELYKDAEEIRHFAGTIDNQLRSHIARGLSSIETAFRLAESLDKRAMVNDDLFKNLIEKHHYAYPLISAVYNRLKEKI